MTEKEFQDLAEVTQIEPLTIDSYICLKYDEIEEPFSLWGWNKNLEKIKQHFLNIFLACSIIHYNQLKQINKINGQLLIDLMDEKDCNINQLNELEKVYIKLYDKVKNSNSFIKLKLSSSKICKYLSKIGYILKFNLFRNPKAALPTALELNKYYEEGEYTFGDLLFDLVLKKI